MATPRATSAAAREATEKALTSPSIASRPPGYCTLTAASTSPSSPCHTARCTWPIEAAAAGRCSNRTKRSRQPGPSSAASAGSASPHGMPGLDSCSDVRASRQLCSGSAGKSASTVDSSWPALSPRP